jgi:DegV family protein with EDD domain
MTVAIVTDSAAALPVDLATSCDVTVVPMRLTLDGQQILEGERDLGELLDAEHVTTSAPTPGAFETAIRDRLGDDGVLVLTIAASMSSTYQAATVAARAVGEEVRVVDTTTAAGAEALVVLAAARAAAAAPIDTVEAAARRVIERVRLVATVPSLDHLVRSGRVPNAAGWAGRRLGIRPLFEFRRGQVRALRPALSPDAALDRIVGLFRREAAPGARAHVAALHALEPDSAHLLLKRVEAEVDPTTAFVGEFGPAMVVHTGPGLVGLAWWWEEPPPTR